MCLNLFLGMMHSRLASHDFPPVSCVVESLVSMRIICERRHRHWSAWFEGSPEKVFGHADVAQAVGRLLGATPGLEMATIAADDEPDTDDQMTFVVHTNLRVDC